MCPDPRLVAVGPAVAVVEADAPSRRTGAQELMISLWEPRKLRQREQPQNKIKYEVFQIIATTITRVYILYQ